MSTTRPLEVEEYNQILKLLDTGFTYTDADGKEKIFRPNIKVKLALILEANLGLRISDILRLQVKNFKNDKLEITEKKTDKLQYRDINSAITNLIKDYAILNNLSPNDFLIDIGERAIQKQLKIMCNFLNIQNISTHSFRKMYATQQFKKNNNNLYLVKELLNHTSIATTQRYIRVSQKDIDKASKDFLLI
ncbi:tyrosine-type recombinase/integrase [Clostridioides difficile]|uniref:tyrosine-type recombinase/integrase n=1 Tax=Clostridioides difficile TaxID=1496 RepID=UPI001A1FE4EE|nr:tyrosine-type recombinase/integrase [Clostridioides difficile]MCA0551515.1 tyrosine-type recombinase/integrase [Clostridioides difficile]MCD8746198.1 tyrosine-type recombinase/integrase [Clostridioides difficile]HBG3822395.1 tyrosine-type recombinase/integrase [Clostridioides difficile]